MRLKILAIFFSLLFILNANSQNYSTSIYLGGSYLFPGYTSSFGENNTKGYGAELTADHYISNHFSVSGRSGIIHFNGNIVTFNREDVDFNSIPVFVGCKYHLHNFFLGIETGPLISTNKSISTHNTFSPLLGFKTNKIQGEISLLNVLGMASIPENSFLISGGYGFYSIKISYNLFEFK